MIYLEMTRDRKHGGGAWSFPHCVWAPVTTRDGRSWRFWEKILQIEEGDLIIHLRGKPPNACFVGHSIAAGSGFISDARPPEPGQWSHAMQFYRADLQDFTPFDDLSNLDRVFKGRKSHLERYFHENKAKRTNKANLFYVIQSGGLRCLNGACLSDIDDELLAILLGRRLRTKTDGGKKVPVSVEAGSALQTVNARRGQWKFSKEIKQLYSHTCCFPGCNITYPPFLVAAHIARWTDNEELRGHLGNGLCLCLLHDKAFEVGLFTLDNDLRVYLDPKKRNPKHPTWPLLGAHHGHPIKPAATRPLPQALVEHRKRVGIDLFS